MGVSEDFMASAGNPVATAVGGPRERVVGEPNAQARVEGLWTRDTVDVLLMWEDVKDRVTVFASAAPAGTELTELSVTQRYTLGVFFAARWTLGLVGHRPLSGLDSAVTDAALRAEVAVAEYLIVSNAPAWDLAAGVRAWISWIVGVSDLLPYPAGTAG